MDRIRPTSDAGQATSRTSLYRVFGSAGELLYVGISKHALARFHEHSKDKEWWSDAEHIAVEHFESRPEALAAEARAIRSERPKWNVAHAIETPSPEAVSRRLEWRCDVCRELIANGTGYVVADLDDVSASEAAWSGYEERKRARQEGSPGGMWQFVDLSDLMTMPPRIEWQVLHRSCDPKPKAPAYWFPVEQARTEAALLQWTSHLLSKTWLSHTNWAEFIRDCRERG